MYNTENYKSDNKVHVEWDLHNHSRVVGNAAFFRGLDVYVVLVKSDCFKFAGSVLGEFAWDREWVMSG